MQAVPGQSALERAQQHRKFPVNSNITKASSARSWMLAGRAGGGSTGTMTATAIATTPPADIDPTPFQGATP